DIDDPDMHYVQIPGEVTWDQFEEVRILVKNNIDFKNYDAALASFYDKTGLQDYVRIYCKLEQLEMLSTIKDAYEREIKRLLNL
ncbi:hypothetical protein ACFL6I_28980, partial [candidate division KSB1 bacterium]